MLERHPRLTAVVAHMGAPEYAEFWALAERYERVHVDTTMIFTDFFEAGAPYPRDLLPRLAERPDKVLLGSDFPTIPYPYAHQLESLSRVAAEHPGLGDDWLRAICWDNPARLLGLPARTTGLTPVEGRWEQPGLRRRSRLGWTHNSRGADWFRLGTLVPGEAGREASVISLTSAGKHKCQL